MSKFINRTGVIVVNIIVLAAVMLVLTVFKEYTVNAFFVVLSPDDVRGIAATAWLALGVLNLAYVFGMRAYYEKQNLDSTDWIVTGFSLFIVVVCIIYFALRSAQL